MEHPYDNIRKFCTIVSGETIKNSVYAHSADVGDLCYDFLPVQYTELTQDLGKFLSLPFLLLTTTKAFEAPLSGHL